MFKKIIGLWKQTPALNHLEKTEYNVRDKQCNKTKNVKLKKNICIYRWTDKGFKILLLNSYNTFKCIQFIFKIFSTCFLTYLMYLYC